MTLEFKKIGSRNWLPIFLLKLRRKVEFDFRVVVLHHL